MRQIESQHFVEEVVSQIEKGNTNENTPKIRYFGLALRDFSVQFLNSRTKLYYQDDPNSFSLSSSRTTSDKSIFESVSEDVLEVETMLLQLRRVLEQVRILTIF